MKLSAHDSEASATPLVRESSNGNGVSGLVLIDGKPYPVIVDVVQGSSAATNSLIKPGMRLRAIAEGGSSQFVGTEWLPLTEIMKLLSGQPGTKVRLNLVRQPADDAQEVVVEVERVPLQNVQSNGIVKGRESIEYEQLSATNEHRSALESPDRRLPTERVIQPSYQQWLKIKPGMTENQVKDLLGEPIRIRAPGPADSHIADYGKVAAASPTLPVDLTFSIWFQHGKVIEVNDPFDGVFSETGLPSKPILINPHTEETFRHYPRFLDLRWYPVSGQYPMEYEIEVEAETKSGWVSTGFTSSEPFIAITFDGQNKGRWRVRGKNALGQGLWSDYNNFEFLK